MINIWKYNAGDAVRITAITGEILEGRIECLTEAEERSDLERQEDGLGLDTYDGRHLEIYQSEVKDIEFLKGARSAEKPRAAI